MVSRHKVKQIIDVRPFLSNILKAFLIPLCAFTVETTKQNKHFAPMFFPQGSTACKCIQMQCEQAKKRCFVNAQLLWECWFSQIEHTIDCWQCRDLSGVSEATQTHINADILHQQQPAEVLLATCAGCNFLPCLDPLNCSSFRWWS